MTFDPVEFGKGLARSVKALIQERLAPLEARIAAIESRAMQPGPQGEKGEPGQQGERGRDADMEQVKHHIDMAVLATVKDCFDKSADSLKGERGERGLAGEVGQIGPQGPHGERGADGPAGIQGAKGEPGKDAQPVDVHSLIAELAISPEIKTVIDLLVAEGIAEYFKTNPVKDGKDGLAGAQGPQGIAGEKGATGADGVGLGGAIIDRDGQLVVTLTNGTVKALGPVIGKDGEAGRDGADGKDGLSVEDRELAYDGDTGEIIERWNAAGQMKEFRYPAVGIRQRGYWREGMPCKAGDGVTNGGSFWIAKRDNTSKPGNENAEDWYLCVRKGRDGERGPAGSAYIPPAPVKLESAK